MIERGEPWGTRVDRSPDVSVTGDDHALATTLWNAEGLLVGWRPDRGSDFARSLGVREGRELSSPPSGLALPLDLMEVDELGPAINVVVVGTAPHRCTWHTIARRFEVDVDGRSVFADRAFGVVVANGQFVDALDLVPRGHPADGTIEVQIYAVPRSQRRELRRRVGHGDHLPHPGIVERRGSVVDIRCRRPVACRVDGAPSRTSRHLSIRVLPGHASVVVL